jgi:3-deoxy-D-manno-octulosonic acid (KDO) 8-phosphate synthase
MEYNMVLTTAEDVVSVVDAIVAKGDLASKEYIRNFTGIATIDQVDKALEMSIQLKLIETNNSTVYRYKSPLSRLLVSSPNDDQKASVMRIILEQYEPFIAFRTRYAFTNSINQSCEQIKALFEMSSNYRDIRSTIISIATYSKALRSEGANLYSFPQEKGLEYIDSINDAFAFHSTTDIEVKQFFGDTLYPKISDHTIITPLVDSIMKTEA